MAKQDELSSTEKLLKLIRNGGNRPGPEAEPSQSSPDGLTAAEAAAEEAPAVSVRKTSPSLLSGLLMRRPATIGVDISENAIRIARVTAHSERQYELTALQTITLDAGETTSTNAFSRTLGRHLSALIPLRQVNEIWASLPSANVETRYLKIPKVPAKQLGNAVLWTFKKDVAFDENDSVFDFQVLNRIVEDGREKLEIMAYTAPLEEVQHARQQFAKSGFALTGVSIVPFAIQNLLRTEWSQPGVDNVCALFLGRDWSRIAIYSEGFLVLSRDIKAGVRSMVEAVQFGLSGEEGPVSGAVFDESGWTPDEALSAAQTTAPLPEVFKSLILENGGGVSADQLDRLEGDQVFSMIQPAIDRVIRQVEMTAQHYFLNFGNARVDRLYVSGTLSTYPPFMLYVEQQLGLPVRLMDPFKTGGGIDPGILVPDDPADRTGYIPAVGMALSHPDRTPNFLSTYKEKEAQRRSRNIGRAVWAVFFLLLAAGVVLLFRQERVLEDAQVQLMDMRRQMASMSPQVDQEIVAQAVAKVRRKAQRRIDYGRRYLGLAVLSEISRLTPPNIRLANLTADLGAVPGNEAAASPPQLLLHGVVFGPRLELEAMMANYVIQLQRSPLFKNASLEEKSFEAHEGKDVLRFTARMEIDR